VSLHRCICFGISSEGYTVDGNPVSFVKIFFQCDVLDLPSDLTYFFVDVMYLQNVDGVLSNHEEVE